MDLARSQVEFYERVDLVRLKAARQLDPARRSQLGQFLTPGPIATFMADLLECPTEEVHLLDAGAGSGSLFSAAVDQLIRRHRPPTRITVTAYELDEVLLPYLHETLAACRRHCEERGISFAGCVQQGDFIEHGVGMLRPRLFTPAKLATFTAAILNPPYLKIHSSSRTRQLLREIGVETSNLYTAFLSVAIRLLAPGGELVAITPRSFCNGPYFRPFREDLLRRMTLQHVHVFESRNEVFCDDAVLQENVIFRAVVGQDSSATVAISSSAGPSDEALTWREVPLSEVVHPNDPQRFIRIVGDDLGQAVADRVARFQTTLPELGIAVSTGRVVEFRARDFLRSEPAPETLPLIYPAHLEQGRVVWPKAGRKPNALARSAYTEELLVPQGTYVLVKRFSSKEERRRIVAGVFEPEDVPGTSVGFENHLNYFHQQGQGLEPLLAWGLAGFLNSGLADAYFRQFNGHTQVNATDLRSFRYPTAEQLRELGVWMNGTMPAQQVLDDYIGSVLLGQDGDDPIQAKQRITDAEEILKALGLPRGQQNERSALTLLALLDLRPETPWSGAGRPLRGITQLMDFFAQHYGRRYAPNTRETVRRQTVHQFLDAGFIRINPDDPNRPTNSGKTVYQVDEDLLHLIQHFETPEWEANLRVFLSSVETLRERYAQEREMARIPVTIGEGQVLTLSPGGQNVLVKQIIEEFAERFVPGGRLIYVGDTDEKFALFDRDALLVWA